MTEMLSTTFHVGGEQLPYQEDSMLPLAIGDGLLWSDGTRFRVVDRWISYEHHGHFKEGLHIFLEPIEKLGPDDRLARLAPNYFKD